MKFEITFVGVKQELHWCQLNVKPIDRLGMNSQSNSGSHLKMTKEPENCLVNFSLLWLLAQKYGLRHAPLSFLGGCGSQTNKPFVA